jgi:hypothetical protein
MYKLTMSLNFGILSKTLHPPFDVSENIIEEETETLEDEKNKILNQLACSIDFYFKDFVCKENDLEMKNAEIKLTEKEIFEFVKCEVLEDRARALLIFLDTR